MSFVYDHQNPPAPHNREIAENRARRVGMLNAIRSLHQPGVDDQFVALAAEVVQNYDESDYLSHDDFARNDTEIGRRICELTRRLYEIREMVVGMRAQSFVGLMAKGLVAAEVVDFELDGQPCKCDPANFMLASLVEGVFQMAGVERGVEVVAQ